MDSWLKDVKIALRAMAKSHSCSILIVLALGLGIASSTAVFSIVHSVLLRPLPYAEPSRLVYAFWMWKVRPIDSVGAADFLFWKEHSQSFSAMGAYEAESGVGISGVGQPLYVSATRISDQLLDVFKVAPLVGRNFLPEEVRPNGPRAVLLAYDLWRNRLGGDRSLIGKVLNIDGESYTIVGVMPPDFMFLASADVYLPLQLVFNPADHAQNYSMVGRLGPGISLDRAQEDMTRVFSKFKEMFPGNTPQAWNGIQLVPYSEQIHGKVRTPLLVIFGAVALVLVVCIVNMASLFWGQVNARRGEIGLRVALGASRFRIFRQLLTESMLLAACGGVLGLAIAPLCLRVLWRSVPRQMSIDFNTSLLPLGEQVSLSFAVLMFGVAIALISGLLVGVMASIHFSNSHVNESLKVGSKMATGNKARNMSRAVMVVAEMSLAMMLLGGAGVLLSSFLQLRAVDPGFEIQNLWIIKMALHGSKYSTTADVWSFEQRVSEHLRALPGVVATASASTVPVERGLNVPTEIPNCGPVALQLRIVSPSYFATMKMPMLQGRELMQGDGADSPQVAVINQTLANLCWKTNGPLGQTLNGAEIVGVVADAHEKGLEKSAPPTVYTPVAQTSDKFMNAINGWFLTTWVVRSEIPLQFAPVQSIIAEIDSAQPVARLESAKVLVDGSFALAKNRFLAAIVAAFSLLAITLSGLGIFSIFSYFVVQQKRELAIRMALGADRRMILRLILKEGLQLAVMGAIIGSIGAVFLNRTLATQIYQVHPLDITVFFGSVCVLLLVAIAGCYVPARIAIRIHPAVALRSE